MLDLYCERDSAAYLAEPLNVLSNLAFFFAAWYALRLALSQPRPELNLLLLPVLMVATGTGSVLFHVFAEPISQLLDIIFLLVFQLVYLWLYFSRIWQWHTYARLAVIILFAISVLYLSAFTAVANGSLLYIPTLVLLLLMTGFHGLRRKNGFRLIRQACLLFSLSLLLRTVDQSICNSLPVGTHFLWHLINAAVMAMMFRLLLFSSVAGKPESSA